MCESSCCLADSDNARFLLSAKHFICDQKTEWQIVFRCGKVSDISLLKVKVLSKSFSVYSASAAAPVCNFHFNTHIYSPSRKNIAWKKHKRKLSFGVRHDTDDCAQMRIWPRTCCSSCLCIRPSSCRDAIQWVETSSPPHFQSRYVDMSAGLKLTRAMGRGHAVSLCTFVSSDCVSQRESLCLLHLVIKIKPRAISLSFLLCAANRSVSKITEIRMALSGPRALFSLLFTFSSSARVVL